MDVVIIEDELAAIRNLMSILNEVPDIQVIAKLESIRESVTWFAHHPQPDLAFMDIHLADGLAFEIFERVSVACPIIFTTAYDEYALKAFSVNSIDYLLKPLDIHAVRKAIHKYRELRPLGQMHEEMQKLIETFRQKEDWRTSFLVPSKGDKLIPLPVAQIAYIYIENGITRAVTFEDNKFVLENTLDELSDMLNPRQFFRANRQFIISRSAVRDVDIWFNYRLSINLKVVTPERIIISRDRNHAFRKWFTTY